jgi:hypothetical protein
MTQHQAMTEEAFQSCIRTIAGAQAGKEQRVFAEWSRHAMHYAIKGGRDKVDIADRLHQAGSAIGLDVDFVQQCLSEAIEFAEGGGNAAPASLSSQAAFSGMEKASSPRSGLEVVCMADVKPSSIDWLWQNWLALGKNHVLAGEGGGGKSTILCTVTAITTTGAKWPDGAQASEAGGVIILAAEDDVEDTLAPRLMAAGADLSRVFVIRSVFDDNKRRSFSLQADLERLEAEIQKRDNVKLVVIDPVSSYLGHVDSHKNSDVRSVLEPLSEMAARLRVAIICNNHFSKGGGSANSRIIGSVAFVNQARAAFIVTPDEDDESRMLLIPSKMNIAPIKHGLAYRIEGCLVEFEGKEIPTSRIMFESAPITISADQALAAMEGNGQNRTDKAEAIDFLSDLLAAGPMPAKDVKKEAVDASISTKSLRSAREALNIKPEKSGFEGGWVWSLPRCPPEVEGAREL